MIYIALISCLKYELTYSESNLKFQELHSLFLEDKMIDNQLQILQSMRICQDYSNIVSLEFHCIVFCSGKEE